MAGEIERWITVNGAHIPIMKGESAVRALGNFIRKRRDKITERRKEARQNEYFDYVLKNYEKNKKGFKQVDKSLKGDELDYRAREYTNNEAGAYMRKKYGENWKDGKRTIKGRQATKEEYLDAKNRRDYYGARSNYWKTSQSGKDSDIVHDVKSGINKQQGKYKLSNNYITESKGISKASQEKLDKAIAATKRRNQRKAYNAARNRWLKSGGK